jgi:hypothetical protein
MSIYRFDFAFYFADDRRGGPVSKYIAIVSPENREFLALKRGKSWPIIKRDEYPRNGNRQYARSSASHVVPCT